MNRPLSAIMVFILLSISLSSSSGQEDVTTWHVYLHEQDGSILEITPEGIADRWELPAGIHEIIVSPTGKAAVLSLASEDIYNSWDYAHELLLYDLETGECCEPFVTPDMFSEIFASGEGGFRMGGFNADGSLFALNYSYYEPCENCPYLQTYGGIAVIDTTTGEIVGSKEPMGDFGGWFGDQIAAYPVIQNPPGMEPAPYQEDVLRLWDPRTDETVISAYRVAVLPYDHKHDIGEMLVTGEHIVGSIATHPTSRAMAYVLYHDGVSAFPVWFDSQSIVIEQSRSDALARWISDGRYIYNRVNAYEGNNGQRTRSVDLLARSGEIERFEIPFLDTFLAGTPDGWLALRMGAQNILVHYTYESGSLQSSEIATIEGQYNMKVLAKPLLGHSLIDPAPFPEVQAPNSLG